MSKGSERNTGKDPFGRLAFRMGVLAAIVAGVAACATGPSLGGGGTVATGWVGAATTEGCSSR